MFAPSCSSHAALQDVGFVLHGAGRQTRLKDGARPRRANDSVVLGQFLESALARSHDAKAGIFVVKGLGDCSPAHGPPRHLSERSKSPAPAILVRPCHQVVTR